MNWGFHGGPSCLLRVRVVPGASRTRLAGWQADGALAARVAAPPEGGRANEALVALLAEALAVARRDIAVVRGHAGRLKTVEVRGLTEAEVRARIAAAVGESAG